METRYGFIHEKIDIKILILSILSTVGLPIDYNTLSDVTMSCDDGIDYFDFADCIAELVNTGHVTEEDDKYVITEKGTEINEITESGLPYSVRVKAKKIASDTANSLRRDAMIHTSHTLKTRGGNIVTMSMSDGMGEIIKLELLAANEETSVIMEENFRKNAENIYLHMIQLLTEGME